MKNNTEMTVDIGSVTIKGVVFDKEQNIVHTIFHPIKGRLLDSFLKVMDMTYQKMGSPDVRISSITGSNAKLISNITGIREVNDIVASYHGGSLLIPQAGSILDIGGEHAKFIRLMDSKNEKRKIIKDFCSNSVCSSGTGAFLEQEAHRLSLSLNEFSKLAVKSKHEVHIASRCCVFAKSDIVHKLQNGAPLCDCAYALCRAIVSNIVAELINIRPYELPIVFIGGVAANRGVLKALSHTLDLEKDSLLVPRYHEYANAIGAYAYHRIRGSKTELNIHEVQKAIKNHSNHKNNPKRFLPPLSGSQNSIIYKNKLRKTRKGSAKKKLIGIDIGSTSTNVVCMTPDGQVTDKYYINTNGKAIAAVFEALYLIKDKYGAMIPEAVGVTGSGRRLISKIIGADFIINEITAHAVGGNFLVPGVDTIFDIGGQDSKFIRLKNGIVINFEMNKVCSAGTGSFLEEMAELLGLNIIDEFSIEGLKSKNPLDMGERCTVFMSSDLAKRMQGGNKREDIVAGLCYSIVKNYLSRVVGNHEIGNKICFQGGVASNPAIVMAMENILKKPIYIHEHHEVAGAIGAALLAGQISKEKSKFNGFNNLDIGDIQTKSFECAKCNNHCHIHTVTDALGNHFFSGGICDRYDSENFPADDKKNTNEFNLFQYRETELLKNVRNHERQTDVLGIPRALHFYDLMPLWTSFFNLLDIPYVISQPTTGQTIEKGIQSSSSNQCLPVKTAYGHCQTLIEQGINRIFIPFIKNIHFGTKRERLNHVCPVVQSWGFIAKQIFSENISIFSPTIHLSVPHFLRKDMIEFAQELGLNQRKVLKAFKEALVYQKVFLNNLQTMGNRILGNLDSDKIYTIIFSRPYTVSDPRVYLRLRKILNSLHIVAVPFDMIGDQPQYCHELDGMYWYYGKRMLQAARALKQYKNVNAVFLSNYGCGSDSFLIHLLRKELADIPLLELEIDEHSDFTGICTRLEAFAYPLKNYRPQSQSKEIKKQKSEIGDIREKRLLIPQMSDHAYAFSAAFQAFNVDARVLPLPDEESVSLGRAAVRGQECCPCTFLIGDMLKYMKTNDSKSQQPAFFMISGDGPCRLGQYPFLQRLVLDENGYKDVPILDASQDQSFYERFGIKSMQFKRSVWKGTVAVDLLYRKWREIRPYTDDREGADSAYQEGLKCISECILRKNRLKKILQKAFYNLDQFNSPANEKKPVIAILGENYIRCNEVANAHIADIIEDLGAEAWFPALYEWVYYTNWTARLHCKYEKKYKTYMKFILIDLIERYDAFRLIHAVRNMLNNLRGPSVSDIFNFSSNYVPNIFEGETIVEIGRTFHYYQKGVSGVLHVIPFGCMGGNIVESFSEKISQDLEGFPIMTIQYDGDIHKQQSEQLEGFVLQAGEWMNRRRIHGQFIKRGTC